MRLLSFLPFVVALVAAPAFAAPTFSVDFHGPSPAVPAFDSFFGVPITAGDILTNGLPVPSHWLHFARVLRAALLLQSSAVTLAEAARRYGYPDGFALSNQMHRLVGVRPSDARRYLGWDWLVEAWIQTEAADGGFSRHVCRTLAADFGLAPPQQATADLEEEGETGIPSKPALPPHRKQRSPA